MNKDGIIAQDIEVQRNEPVRIPIEIWKDDKMLFPEFDESIGGRNLALESGFNAKGISTYLIKSYPITRSLAPGKAFTVILKGKLFNSQQRFRLFDGIGQSGLVYIGSYDLDGIAYNNFTVSPNIPIDNPNRLNIVHLYQVPNLHAENLVDVDWICLYEDHITPPLVWTPAPEDLLNYAKINPVNCSYEIDGSDIILSNFTENKGYVDIEVSYGDDWIRTKRINFTRKNRIHDIQIKDKKPFRAYFNGSLIWWKYHEKTQAVFDYAAQNGYSLPSNKIAYDDLIRGLVKEGLFDKLDLFYLFSGDGDINFKLTNLINPGTYDGTAYGGLEWTNEGVKGNGVNGYIDTNLNLRAGVDSDILRYKLGNATRGGIIHSLGDNNIFDGTLCWTEERLILGENGIKRLQGSSPPLLDLDFITTGFICLTRDNFTQLSGVVKDQAKTVNNNTSSVLPNSGQNILRSVISSGYSDLGLSCYFIGSHLTYEQTQTFRQIYNKYLSSIGLEPIA